MLHSDSYLCYRSRSDTVGTSRSRLKVARCYKMVVGWWSRVARCYIMVVRWWCRVARQLSVTSRCDLKQGPSMGAKKKFSQGLAKNR